MAPPQEQDYIGLSPAAAAATELRLGLPGTEEADGGEAAAGTPLTLELLPKGGAKRGFTDAIVRREAAARGKAPAEDEEVDKKKTQAPAAK
jgi:auxin-responsive protein IAA